MQRAPGECNRTQTTKGDDRQNVHSHGMSEQSCDVIGDGFEGRRVDMGRLKCSPAGQGPDGNVIRKPSVSVSPP